MGNKTSVTLFLLCAVLAIPSSAFAFQDLPTGVATLPAMLFLTIPIVTFEVYSLQTRDFGSRTRVAAASLVASIITTVSVLAIARLHLVANDKIQSGFLLGVFQFGTPSVIDVLYSCTLGSALLIQRKSYFLVNIVVIAVS
jgi:hypothetical protein